MVQAKGTKRARYGTKDLIKQVLEDPESKGGLKTSDLVAKVQKKSGVDIPRGTIFQAANSLTRRRELVRARDGREYRFKSPGKTMEQTAPAARLTPPAATDSSGPLWPDHPVDSFPHRLDPGQMLVLSHDGKTVVTLTNQHGRPVVERLKVA